MNHGIYFHAFTEPPGEHCKCNGGGGCRCGWQDKIAGYEWFAFAQGAKRTGSEKTLKAARESARSELALMKKAA